MSARSTVRYGYSDYLAIPEDSSRRYEIVDGELHVTAAPRFRHQQVVRGLLLLLDAAAREHELGEVVPGPVTVRLRDDLVLEPDIVFVRNERMAIVDADGRIQGPPDLVVEVLSPSTRAYDRDLKRKRYLEGGVPEVWIVDPGEGSLEVWTRGGSEPSRRCRDVVEWAVGEVVAPIDLEGVFRSGNSS